MRKYSFTILCLIVLFSVISSTSVKAQVKPLKYSIGVISAAGSKGELPFWFYTDRFGKIDPNSANLLTDINVSSGYDANKKWGYGYGAELIGRASSHSTVYLGQLYFKAHYGHLTIHIGRIDERLNTHMPSLSSGSVMWSGNATPMPKIAIYFPTYAPVPFTHGYLEIKGYWSQGFFGKKRYVMNAMLQQKQLYFRVGGSLPVKAFIGLTDDALWGGTSRNPSVGKLPEGLKNYLRVFFGRPGGPHSNYGAQINALGDHKGSWELGAQFDLGRYKGIIYRQTIFEDKSGLRLGQGSINDGILGVGIQSKDPHRLVSGVLWQYIYTKDQSGPAPSDPPKVLPPGATSKHDAAGQPWGGRDDYFNNYIYRSGWTYFGRTIGTPFITTANSWQAILNGPGIINNRVVGSHVGIEGMISDLSYKAFVTYTKNYGTYTAKDVALSHNQPYEFYPPKKQYSIYYQVDMPIKSVPELSVEGAVSADLGNMYGKNYGIMLGIKYSGILHFMR